MREIYRNPTFYYILVAILITLWPVWLALGSIPAADKEYEDAKVLFKDAEKIIGQILNLDPQRLDYARAQKKSGEFDYPVAVSQSAKTCSISLSQYKLSTFPIVKRKAGQTSQDAMITLNKVGIEKFARFVSLMQIRWPNLKCSQLRLNKVKGAKNIWKADIRFTYYQ